MPRASVTKSAPLAGVSVGTSAFKSIGKTSVNSVRKYGQEGTLSEGDPLALVQY